MKKLRILLIIIFCNILIASVCLARAGGSGGGSRSSGSSRSSSSSKSSSSSSSNSNSSQSQSRSSSPIIIIPPVGGSGGGSSGTGSPLLGFFIAFVVIGGIIFVIYKMSTRGKSLSSVSGFRRPDVDEKFAAFMAANPDFNIDEFRKKVEKGFLDVQDAWSAGNMDKARRYISDGVYQRFATQILMMNALKQRDEISDAKIMDVTLAGVDIDGLYDILHARITAKMKDKFISETDSSLNSPGGSEMFSEFWSFIRKRGTAKKDLYYSQSCPNCSAPLPESMGDSSSCPYCKTLVNSAEYDWVLSEITQPEDFEESEFDDARSVDLDNDTASLIKESDDFSVQLVEDKASNGYLQIMTALTLNEPERMRRFVTDPVFEKLKTRITQEKIYYNRIYLNDVSLLAVQGNEKKNTLVIGVKCSCQHVKLEGKKAVLLDKEIYPRLDILVMERNKGKTMSKGSLYAHQCPSCGAPVSDSLEVKCGYCGVPMNSAKNEWIISDLIEVQDLSETLESLGIETGSEEE